MAMPTCALAAAPIGDTSPGPWYAVLTSYGSPMAASFLASVIPPMWIGEHRM
jgi:hypothetical protein